MPTRTKKQKPAMELPKSRSEYRHILKSFAKLPPEQQKKLTREACLTDLFFLLVYILGQVHADNDFVFARCREVAANPDGHLDLWSREHYKSTIITFALTIQDILRNPEATFGIFSHIRPIAKGFLRQIKFEFEFNETLQDLFDDVLWKSPRKEATKWSEDEGIVVKRTGNQREATVEAWGIIDGMPTSKHFSHMVYDDLVTEKSVTTPEMITKVTTCWELSRSLTREGGVSRYIGTRYHYNDTYRVLISRGIPVRKHPATDDGTFEGTPVLWSSERLAEKRREMGPYIAACQLMQDPKADEAQGFKEEWLRTYGVRITPQKFQGTKCILVDPAGEKKKDSDFTAMIVWGIAGDGNLYLLDMIRDRLNLAERTRRLFQLHRKWRPNYSVGYEKYGKDSDIEHIRGAMEQEEYRFDIVSLPLKGQAPMGKMDRIKRLIPYFEQHRIWLPETLNKTDYQKQVVDLVEVFKEEEYKAFPVPVHDDMLDAMASIFDLHIMGIPFPDDLARKATSAITEYDEFSGSLGGGMVADTEFDDFSGGY